MCPALEGCMWRNAVRAFIFLCLTWTAVWAQSTAQLSGTVRDQSGPVLPGVEVRLHKRRLDLNGPFSPTKRDLTYCRTCGSDRTGWRLACPASVHLCRRESC